MDRKIQRRLDEARKNGTIFTEDKTMIDTEVLRDIVEEVVVGRCDMRNARYSSIKREIREETAEALEYASYFLVM